MIDLEKFPTNETAQDMMGMISPIYDNSYVGKWIFEVMGRRLGFAQEVAQDLQNQAFPETATWSLPYWEQSYGIETNEALSTEARRSQVIRKRNFRKPMNPARIELLTGELSGRTTKVFENTAPSTYEIRVYPGDSLVNLRSLLELVNEIKQATKKAIIVFETTITARVRAEPRKEIFPYVVSGTRPDAANVGVYTSVQLQASLKGDGATYSYPTANTERKSRGAGAMENSGLSTQIEGQAASILYKVCGAKRL